MSMAIDALIITIAVCLFSYLGLKDELLVIYDYIMPKERYIVAKIRDALSCTKCISFWLILSYGMINGYAILWCIIASFIGAFLSLWIDLILVYINKIYDKLWEDM